MRTLLVEAPLRRGRCQLSEDEAHHARSVLRLAVGEEIVLADGAGRRGLGRVIAIERHRVDVDAATVDELCDGPASLLCIAAAPPKGDRYGELLRALCELGVGSFRPLRTTRGVRMGSDPERALRIVREALKQCGRSRLMEVLPECDVAALCAQPAGQLVVCDAQGAPAAPGLPTPTTLIIGPEGGLTEDERTQLRHAGAIAVRLARPILRIDTAALAAAAVWTAAWERP